MISKLNILGWLLLCITHYFAFAQNTGSISGNLKHGNEAIEFATIALLRDSDSSLVKGTLSDSSGAFRFDHVSYGAYIVKIELMGYRPVWMVKLPLSREKKAYLLGDIEMLEDNISLETVTITAKTPLVEQQIDKTVLNVENSILSEGNTALEILQRAPGVGVDDEGNITLKGKQGVTVMLNGKLTYLSQKELAALLKGTSSSSIAKVEIITNPSAKYDAAGNSGIINIVLKKNVKLGMNGSAYANAGSSRKTRYGSGLSLNYRSGRVHLFSSYDFAYRGEKEYLGNTRRFRDNPSDELPTRFSEQNTITDEPLFTNNFRVGTDYSFNDKNSIGFVVNGNIGTYANKSSTHNMLRTTSGEVISDAKSFPHDEDKWSSLLYNLNYKRQFAQEGREWTVDLDYSRNSFNANQLLDTKYSDPQGNLLYNSTRKGQLPSLSHVYVGKTDYVHPLGKEAKLEAGWKSSYVKVDNDVVYDTLSGTIWRPDISVNNRFTYKEIINAGYFSLHKKLGSWKIQAGLRGENTHTEGHQITLDSLVKRNYFQLFPSMFISRELTSSHTFQISYSRRIDRPDYGDLNPFRFYRDPYLYYMGNPYLLPELTNAFELSHSFKGKLITTLNYSRTDRSISWVMQQVNTTNTSFESPQNLKSFTNYGLSMNATVDITTWWSGSYFGNVFYNEYKGENLKNSVVNYSFNLQNTFPLGNGFSAELNGIYNSRSIYSMFTFQPMYKVSGGIQKTLLKGTGTVKVSVNDIFQTYKRRQIARYESVDMTGYNNFDSRTIMFSFTYRFGNNLMNKNKDKEKEDELKRVKGAG